MSVFTNPSSGSVENARAYTAAVLDLVGSRDPMHVLHDTPAALTRTLAGLSPAQLGAPETSGKWSIRQVMAHLADSEIVWGWRLRLVLAEDRPRITGYDQDCWASRLRYDQADVQQSLDVFTLLRRAHLQLLAAATPEDRKRVGVHSERGEESVEHMIRMYAGHDLLHLRQIERIRGVVVSAVR